MDLAEPLQQTDRTYVRWRGKKLTYFGGCDYFRLSSHPEILQAIKNGIDQFGLNVAASRFTTGNHQLYGRLEEALCRFFKVQTATLVSNGYATNIVAGQALAGSFSHALIDSRAHQSLRDCLPFLACDAVEFPHLDADKLSGIIRRCGRKARVVLLTDGLFSHDGSLAPVNRYLEILPRGSKILLDDAHGAGTIGQHGRGTPEILEVDRAQIIQTISLSKGFGVYGGAILGSTALRQKILRHSSLIKGNTPLPLPLAHAAIRSLELLRTDYSLRHCLEWNSAHVQKILTSAPVPHQSPPGPIVAIKPPTASQAKRLRQRLFAEGIFPTEIRYHDAKPYFRFAISSEHSRAQLDALIRACHTD
jgi:8-amino-7-oxononanoate synthase